MMADEVLKPKDAETASSAARTHKLRKMPLSCLSITRQSFSATNHQKCCFSTQDMPFSTMKIEKALDDNFDGDGKGKLQVFRAKR